MERMDDKYRKEKYNTRHAGFLAVFLAAALLPGLFPATAQRVEAAGIHSIEVVVRSLNVEGMMLPEDIADIIGVYLQFRKTNAVIDEIEAHRVTKEPFA